LLLKAAAHLVRAVANLRNMQIENADNYRKGILELLEAENLPVADLPLTLENFLIALQNEELIGVVGVEIYGDYGLLRSLSVRSDFRNMGVAANLLQRIDALSRLKKLKELYLLTETAPGYFDRKGYKKIARADVPTEIQQSSEFSHICPQSAIVMKKVLITTKN